MRNYTELLTETEISNIVSSYLQANGNPDKTKEILDLLAFYSECGMIFSAVVSGDVDIVGIGENGLEIRASQKALNRLH